MKVGVLGNPQTKIAPLCDENYIAKMFQKRPHGGALTRNLTVLDTIDIRCSCTFAKRHRGDVEQARASSILPAET